MMKRWWLLGTIVFLIALIAIFPLRIALDMSTGQQSLLSARQVAGSVWDGRIGEAMLGEQRLGTFDVSLRPIGLLVGNVEADIERVGGLEGPLVGTLALGNGEQGFRNLSGSVGVARLMAPVPVDLVEFNEATVLFDDERCTAAQGTVNATASLGLLGLSRSLSGPLSCAEDGRLRAVLSGGNETLTILLAREGAYEARLAVLDPPPLVASGLALAGFALQDGQLTLTHQGTLR